MWKFTARTTHGQTLTYSAPTRESARKRRALIERAPFVVSTTTPSR